MLYKQQIQYILSLGVILLFIVLLTTRSNSLENFATQKGIVKPPSPTAITPTQKPSMQPPAQQPAQQPAQLPSAVNISTGGLPGLSQPTIIINTKCPNGAESEGYPCCPSGEPSLGYQCCPDGHPSDKGKC